MLLKNVVGIEGGLGIDHFLISDLFFVAISAALALRLSGFPLSRLAISADCRIQLRNFRSCFQLLPDSANGFVIDLGLLSNLPVAFGRVGLQQHLNNRFSILTTEMTAMDVGADDVVASISINASEVGKGWLPPRKLTSAIAIIAVEDFALVEDYVLA